MPERKVLCLLGMHRSGTSLIAHWLQQCGLNMGENLLQADFSNQKGHFEDIDFLSLHKEVLAANGLNPSGLEIDSEKKINWPHYHAKKREHTIALKNELNKQWGWKDPRTCLFIDSYRAEIPGLTFLIVHRPAAEVIHSLLKRDWNRWKSAIALEGWWGFHPKFLLQPYFRRKQLREKLPLYQKACERYFKDLLILAESKPEALKVVSLQSFLTSEKVVLDYLTTKGFELVHHSAKIIFNSELMGGPSVPDYYLNSTLKALDLKLHNLCAA